MKNHKQTRQNSQKHGLFKPLNLISIEILGGCVDDFCEGAEDQHGVFQEGESLRLYLEKSDDGFVFTCGLFGVSSVNDKPRIVNVG